MSETIKIAGALMVSRNGDLLLRRRDNKPGVSSPGMLSIFGGMVEAGEGFEQAMLREIEEETGLCLPQGGAQELASFTLERPQLPRTEAGFFLVENVDPQKLTVVEGVLEIVSPEKLEGLVQEVVPTTMLAISIYLQKRKAGT